MSTEIGNIGIAVNTVANVMRYAAEILPDDQGNLRPELTEDGLKDFIKANKDLFGSKKVREALAQAQTTLARRQNLGAPGSLAVDVSKVYQVLMGFVETHIDNNGDPLRLDSDEAKDLGATAAAIVNRYAMSKLTSVNFDEVVVPQEFQKKGAAIREYLLGPAVESTRNGRWDTWLSESDMNTAVDRDVAAGVISEEFGEAAKKTFYYAAQYIYRGFARTNGRSNEICQDMERDFQRALNRLAGKSSATGAAIDAVSLSEAETRLGVA